MTTSSLRFPLRSARDPAARAAHARRPVRALLALLLTSLVLVLATLPAAAATPPANDVGPNRVYFPQTGHYLAYGFLDFWHHNGGITTFGYPITEEIIDPSSGLTVQYFERAMFEWHPEASAEWRVQLRRIGSELTDTRRAQSAFRPVTAMTDTSCTFYPQTGHRLCSGFRSFWNREGGLPIFGYPISEEFNEGGYTVQYFERVRIEWHRDLTGTPFEVQLGLLGNAAAQRYGVNTEGLPQSMNTPTYEPDLWFVPEPSGPREVRTPPAGAPSNHEKWIEIDLSDQYLRAWEYSSVVYGTYVSTGVAAYPTPTGTFAVHGKLAYDDLTSGLVGPQAVYYDVPFVMYFYDGYAIHSADWHDNFGTPMSRGTVELPLGAAHWLYDWTPYDTVVWIHK